MFDDPADDTADAGIDKISELPDDVLLDILGRLFTAGDVRTAARTSILSRRWRHLPWPEISCCILYRTVILQLVFFSCSVSQLENKRPGQLPLQSPCAGASGHGHVARFFLLAYRCTTPHVSVSRSWDGTSR